MKQQIISLLERAKENGTTIGDVLAEVRGMRPVCTQLAETKLEWITTPDIRDVPDCVLTPSGIALKQSQISAQDGRTQVDDERCKRCGGPGWYTSHTTGYPESIPCSACNPQGVSVERLAKDPFFVAQLWRKPEDFADAYEGAREDLAIWKRRALEAERDLRAERETSSRLVAALNAESGPTHMGERAALASAPVVKPSPEHFKPPFGNCSFRMCDLPGQCRAEGKCHHPASAPVAGEAQPVAWMVYASDTHQLKRIVTTDPGDTAAFGCLKMPLYAAPQASTAADERDAKDAVVASIQAAIDGMRFDYFNATPRQMEFIKAGARLVIEAVNTAIAAQQGEGGA
ncbi:hypothetical protein [Bordetella trematum]|uniref:hypothetical protein n=1 Tax=Bordetella trematum TaxID=123899 RepID=UPI003AF34AF1